MKTRRLFHPNQHSRWRITWRDVAPVLKRELAGVISRHFNVDYVEIGGIRQVNAWEKNSNNFKVPVIKLGKKFLILFRRHRSLGDLKSLKLLDQLSDYLIRSGIHTPRVIITKERTTSFRDGAHLYTAYEFIAGDHFRGTKKELAAMGRSLAALHRALAKLPFSGIIKRRKPLLPLWSEALWRRIFDQALRRKRPIDCILMRRRGAVESAIKTVTEQYLPKKKRMPRQVIHSDFHPHNAIFVNNALLAVIDFEHLEFNERMRDVAQTMHRCVRQFAIYQKGDPERHIKNGMRIFLGAYVKVQPLTREELELFPALIADHLLRKIIKDVSLYYSTGDDSKLVDGELDNKLNLLEEARYFEVSKI